MYRSQLESFLEHPLSEVEYVQDFYNILEKKAEDTIFPYLKSEHKFMAYSPLYRWLLTSLSMKELLEKNEDGINMMIKNSSLPHIHKQKLLYDAASEKRWQTLQEIALNFLDKNENVNGIIFWTTKLEHLDTFLEAIIKK